MVHRHWPNGPRTIPNHHFSNMCGGVAPEYQRHLPRRPLPDAVVAMAPGGALRGGCRRVERSGAPQHPGGWPPHVEERALSQMRYGISGMRLAYEPPLHFPSQTLATAPARLPPTYSIVYLTSVWFPCPIPLISLPLSLETTCTACGLRFESAVAVPAGREGTGNDVGTHSPGGGLHSRPGAGP